LRNTLINPYFREAWTPLPLKLKNRISIVANGARNELQIDHLPLEAGIPLFSLDPREIVVLKTGVFPPLHILQVIKMEFTYSRSLKWSFANQKGLSG